MSVAERKKYGSIMGSGKTENMVERENFVEKVKKDLELRGLHIAELPEGWSMLKWRQDPTEKEKTDTGIRIISRRPYLGVPRGAIGRVLGLSSETGTIMVEWITATEKNGSSIIDGFSGEEFLMDLKVLTEKEAEPYILAADSRKQEQVLQGTIQRIVNLDPDLGGTYILQRGKASEKKLLEIFREK